MQRDESWKSGPREREAKISPEGHMLLRDIQEAVLGVLGRPGVAPNDLRLRVSRERFDQVVELPDGTRDVMIHGVPVLWDDTADPWTIDETKNGADQTMVETNRSADPDAQTAEKPGGSAGFTPLDVRLVGAVPLTGVFNKAEAEAAAAWLIIGMRANGNVFAPIQRSKVAEAVRPLIDAGCPSWIVNPFLVPDFARLDRDGYIRLDGDTVEFTVAGIEKLRRWVREDEWSGG